MRIQLNGELLLSIYQTLSSIFSIENNLKLNQTKFSEKVSHQKNQWHLLSLEAIEVWLRIQIQMH